MDNIDVIATTTTYNPHKDGPGNTDRGQGVDTNNGSADDEKKVTERAQALAKGVTVTIPVVIVKKREGGVRAATTVANTMICQVKLESNKQRTMTKKNSETVSFSVAMKKKMGVRAVSIVVINLAC